MVSPAISRQLDEAADRPHDLIVIGGGIYGACLTLEAARRGLRPLLLERDDFGGATSWNSLRIVHGGLRYLQTLDLPRYRRSVAEQSWWLENFPDLISPLRCLMPLYGMGLRRNSILRMALLANHLLAGSMRRGRHAGILPRGSVLQPHATTELFPDVDQQELRGGAVWWDALITSPQRLLIEVLRWAGACGASMLNYVEATELQIHQRRVVGVGAVCGESGRALSFQAPCVVNCAGPWAQQLAAKFDDQVPAFFQPSVAFNVLLDRRPLSSAALCVSPKTPQARTYFVVPHGNYMLAGTVHRGCTSGDVAAASEELVPNVIDDLNATIPSLKLRQHEILRVFTGVLPAEARGSATQKKRPVIYDHLRHGGPAGLVSVAGVKYTTARAIAEDTLRLLQQSRQLSWRPYRATIRPSAADQLNLLEFPGAWQTAPDSLAQGLRELIQDEAVVHLDDLLLRRTEWGQVPSELPEIAAKIADVLGWTGPRREAELRRCGNMSYVPAQTSSLNVV